MLKKALTHYFGFSDFRPGQEAIIQGVLEKQDTLGLLPTGAGKSLCYQLPGYLTPGLVVIISPLLSLMEDQVYNLQKNGEKRVIALTSQLTYSERRFILRNLAKYKFLFLSPEMALQEEVLQALKTAQVGLFVIDEAHCVSQWGIDFRPEYLALGDLKVQLGNPVTLALTATATSQVVADINQVLLADSANFFKQSMNRENIGLFVEKTSDKLAALKQYTTRLSGSGIIYCATRKQVELLYHQLQNEAYNVAFYHGGLAPNQRRILQQQFAQNELHLLVATNAFGMGINKPDVRFVLHYNMPDSLENYSQEIGRAGRDGKPSYAILLYQKKDEGIHHFFRQEMIKERRGLESQLEKEKPENLSLLQQKWLIKIKETNQVDFLTRLKNNERWKAQRLEKMLGYIETTECRRKYLLTYFEEEKKAVKFCCDNDGLNLPKQKRMEIPEKKVFWQDSLLKMFKN